MGSDVRTKLEEAVAAVKSSSEDPVSSDDLLVLGNGYYAVGRYEEASIAYLTILKDEPANADARFNLGLAYLRLRILRMRYGSSPTC